jgi:hypothetical protein
MGNGDDQEGVMTTKTKREQKSAKSPTAKRLRELAQADYEALERTTASKSRLHDVLVANGGILDAETRREFREQSRLEADVEVEDDDGDPMEPLESSLAGHSDSGHERMPDFPAAPGQRADSVRGRREALHAPEPSETAIDAAVEIGPNGEVGMEAFQRLVVRAKRGDPAAMPQIQKAMNANPAIWLRLGDQAALAEMGLIRLVAEDDPAMIEAVTRHVMAMRRELHGPSPSLLRRMVAQRIAVAWLLAQFTDRMSAVADQTMPEKNFWSRRQVEADRRLNLAIKSLRLIQQIDQPGTPLPTTAASKAVQESTPDPKVNPNGKVNGKPHAVNGNSRNGHIALDHAAEPGANGHSMPLPGRNGHNGNGHGSSTQPPNHAAEDHDDPLLTLGGFNGPENRIAALAAVAAGESLEGALAQCGPCEHRQQSRCTLCRCFIAKKAWLPHEDCPLGRWPA